MAHTGTRQNILVQLLNEREVQCLNLSDCFVDKSGAVIPGVLVTVTNLATGVTREVQTSDDGFIPLAGA